MFVNINGTRIHYLAEGNGLPCVIPTLAGSPIYERTFSKKLREHLQLIFVELRANRSDVGDVNALTLDSIVDDLDRFRAALNLERIAVLGHSGHGFLALQYAVRHPERISHAIMVATAPMFGPALEAEQARSWDTLASQRRKDILARNHERVGDLMRNAATDEAMIAGYVANGPLFWYDAEFDCTELWGGQRPSAKIFERFWGPGGEFSKFDPKTALPKIKCPVFIASGNFDFATVSTAWHKTKDLISNHTFRAFEKSGHYPHFEEQELFDATLLEWLKTH
ncbi:MAG: alpha/beta hydrolase [Candidatus Binatus sp.]|uniref:alpha/beta fold hydrolase n=1 Tax=Candidatus Binatus sp. TaxID=2811406 RepID=UPI002717D743|nr:alpha/beta hydrolase [Candidatus Binatus sp.]MDO8431671.1 alpha/beta hydrolase [Candidatus Binatus sp.]